MGGNPPLIHPLDYTMNLKSNPRRGATLQASLSWRSTSVKLRFEEVLICYC